MEDHRIHSASVQTRMAIAKPKFKSVTETIVHKFIVAFALSGAALILATSWSAPAHAQYCEGTVHGLSGYYNQATGSGFLAVRAGPKASATQRGELFNGDKVEVFTRRGNWYKIATTEAPMLEGWVNAHWLHNECAY